MRLMTSLGIFKLLACLVYNTNKHYEGAKVISFIQIYLTNIVPCEMFRNFANKSWTKGPIHAHRHIHTHNKQHRTQHLLENEV